MKSLNPIDRFLRRLTWSLIGAFMVGIHNFYEQEMDSAGTIVSSIQMDEEGEVSSPIG